MNKMIVILAGVIGIPLVTMNSVKSVPERIDRLEVRDLSVTGSLGILDRTGKRRIVLSAGTQGAEIMILRDDGKTPGILLAWEAEMGVVSILHGHGEAAVSLQLSHFNTPVVELGDQKDRVRLTLGIDPDGSSRMSVGPGPRPQGSGKRGGSLCLNGAEGKALLELRGPDEQVLWTVPKSDRSKSPDK